MVYWCEIVDNYGSPGMDRKDHGTFSERIVAILLIYLALGADYPSSIARFFIELSERKHMRRKIPSTLENSGKISSVLKRMRNDGLVNVVNEISAGAGTRKYYKINPQILQSPVKDEPFFKADGSILEVPLDTVNSFLKFFALEELEVTDKIIEEELRRARHELLDDFLEDHLDSSWLSYNTFIEIIKILAHEWDELREQSDPHPSLEELMICYEHMTPH